MSCAANNSHLSTGYVKLYRSIMEDETHFLQENREATRHEAKLDLLLSAQGTPRWRNVDGESLLIERGSMFCSVSYLAKRWRWSKHRVHDFLHFLEVGQFVSRLPHKKGTMLAIVNYNQYNPLSKSVERGGNVKGTPRERQGTPRERI